MGIDRQLFVKPPAQDYLTCKKCGDIYNNCVEKDGKKYCQSCADFAGISKYVKSDKTNAIIANLQVYCKNKKLNCSWIGKYGEITTHLMSCPYKPTKCANPSCNYMGSKDLVEIHFKSCLYRACEACHRLFKDSPLSIELTQTKSLQSSLVEKLELLTEEMIILKMEHHKLLEQNETQQEKISFQQDQIDLMEMTHQDKLQMVMADRDMDAIGSFMEDNFDLLKEQFVSDNIKLNKDIKDLKRANEELVYENLKLKDTRDNLDLFRDKIIELEKQNLILKTNENYKELSKKLITKCDLLTEQNQLLSQEIRMLNGQRDSKINKELKEIQAKEEEKDEKIDITKGVISDLYNGVIKSNPIVQLMNKFQKFVTSGKERYKVWISDGINSYPAITGTAPSLYISEGTLVPYSIVRILECVKDTKLDVLIITDLEILDNECRHIIGSPVRIDSKLFIWTVPKSEIVNLKFSPVFIIKGLHWKLQLCHSKANLGILLTSVNLKAEIKVEYNFMIMHPSTSDHYRGPGTKWHTFTKESQGTGWTNFIKNSALVDYLKDDSINICVTITAIEEKDEKSQ